MSRSNEQLVGNEPAGVRGRTGANFLISFGLRLYAYKNWVGTCYLWTGTGKWQVTNFLTVQSGKGRLEMKHPTCRRNYDYVLHVQGSRKRKGGGDEIGWMVEWRGTWKNWRLSRTNLLWCHFVDHVDYDWNVMAHAQKPDFVFRRNGRVHLNRRGCQFGRLLAAEVCTSAVVMLDEPCSEVVWRVLATHSIRQFSLHFPSRASPCAITFPLESTFI